jgi:hypothetical protein
VTIQFKDISSFYLPEDKAVFASIDQLKETAARLRSDLVTVDAAIANDTNPDPDPDSRLANLIAGNSVVPVKSWSEQRLDLQRAMRDVENALDFMAGKKRAVEYQAGARLAHSIKAQHDAAEKTMVDALVVAHERHFLYWQAKRHLLNNGIGIYGLFSSDVDNVLGIPIDKGTPLADLLRTAVTNGFLKAVPESLR